MIDGIFKKLGNTQIAVSVTASVAMIVDNIFIARFLGVQAVAAAGLITPVLMIVLAFSGVLSAGGQLVVGTKMGSGEREKAAGSASLCFALVLLASFFAVFLTFGFTERICIVLGAAPGSELAENASAYLRGYVLGAPGIIGMLSMVPLLNIDGDKKRSLTGAWVVTIGDVLLDVVAVLVFPGSLFAIALASALSYLAGFLVICGHFLKKDDRFALKLRLRKIPWAESKQVFRLGFPAALQKILRTALSFTVNRILLSVGGAVALAGFSIVSNIGNLLNSVGQGLSAATLTMAGVLYGERIKKSLSELYRSFVKYSVLWNLVIVLITLVFAEPLVGVFLSSKKVDVSAVVTGLRLFSLDFVFYSLCLCAKSYYQGIKRMRVNYLITVVEGYLCIAFFTWLFGRFFGFYGVCLGYGVGDAVSVLSIVLGVLVTEKRLPRKADDFLLLQEDVLPEDRVFSSTLTGTEEIGSVCRKAGNFVKDLYGKDGGEGLAEKTSALVAACACNLPRQKKASAEFHLICENDSVTVLINDNVPGFSLADRLSEKPLAENPDTPAASASVEQYRVLGINKTKVVLRKA
ncbi:MAG: MATE family efflux transporter [Clostridia bacterium]|nr:MATE family efflux transporter [Clostridia bacterium]